jgi:hypothetical protein
VIATGSSGAVSWQLGQLGVNWYLDYDWDTSSIPSGRNKVLFVPMGRSSPLLTESQIQTAAARKPGSYWYLGGEPNASEPSGNRFITPDEYIPSFDYYVQTIKKFDPTAKVTGPSILNWDDTCRGCAGYQSGHSWLADFVQKYRDTHGGRPPPVDIWAIDAYPLTWDKVPMTEWDIVRNQITGMRSWINQNVPELASKPIWITEIASHWAYSSWRVADGYPTIGAGLDWDRDYLWNDMGQYMTSLFNWLKANGPALNVEKWFLFSTYTNIREQVKSEYYAGIYLFQAGTAGAPLNQLGQLYRDYATGRR